MHRDPRWKLHGDQYCIKLDSELHISFEMPDVTISNIEAHQEHVTDWLSCLYHLYHMSEPILSRELSPSSEAS